MSTIAAKVYNNVELLALTLCSYLPIHFLRTLALRIFGAEIGSGATFYHGFQVRAARKICVGARTTVGDGAILDARGGLTLGQDVNLSTRVQIWTAQHDWRSPDFSFSSAPVVIGDRAWLGPNCIVLPGATIGEGAVVAAGAVVRGVVEPYTLVGGVPARKLGDRPQDLRYHLTPSTRKPWGW